MPIKVKRNSVCSIISWNIQERLPVRFPGVAELAIPPLTPRLWFHGYGPADARSEERRVGKESRYSWSTYEDDEKINSEMAKTDGNLVVDEDVVSKQTSRGAVVAEGE